MKQASALLFTLLLGGAACSSKEGALARVGCAEAVAPYTTHYEMNKLGIGSYACVRLSTSDESVSRQIEAGCVMCKGPVQQTTYPAQSHPSFLPRWWDLEDGEPVEYAARLPPGDHWHGLLYRKHEGASWTWYMCASGD